MPKTRNHRTDRPLGDVIRILGDDFDRLTRRMMASANRGAFTDTDASHARSFVRAFFALVEGTCNALKMDALGQMLDDDREIEPGVKEIVFEERYDLDGKGRGVVRPFTYPVESNVKFAFRIYAEAYGRQYSLDTSAEWWAALLEMKSTRNHLDASEIAG